MPHPAVQLKLCLFYANHADLLLYLCSRSSFSIRKPKTVASHFFEKSGLGPSDEAEEGEVEIDPDPFKASSGVASSYFTYKKYNLQYRFFESYEFIALEKRFKLFGAFDVHKCFYNIYTHTFAWAVKGREYAKNNRADGFENEFDRLMQVCNFGETNGIIVGPEFSRVFAEIIFQALDLQIQKRLADKGFRESVDFEIRRYVDDYFVFANREEVLKEIKSFIESSLSENRLYLNDSKASVCERPFLSELSKAKMGVSKTATNRAELMLEAALNGKLNLVTKNKSRFIEEFRSIAIDSREFIEPLSKFAMAILGRRLKKALDALLEIPDQSERDRSLLSFCSGFAEVFEYLYCLSPNARSSLLLSRVFLRILGAKEMMSLHYSQELVLTLPQRVKGLINTGLNNSTSDVSELNLLILDRQISPNDGVPLLTFMNWIHDHLSYFELCTLIFYARDRIEYRELLIKIEGEIKRRAREEKEGLTAHHDTELVMLLLDSLSCPWISDDTKKIVSESIVLSVEPSIKRDKLNERSSQLRRFCAKRLWFFDWHAAEYLEKTLDRKELIPAYS